MITYNDAFKKVMLATTEFGEVAIPLSKAHGRILAEPIRADRDFPPFDRATKDGIAIKMGKSILNAYPIEGIAAAGDPQIKLTSEKNCVEIMTGAVVPKNADTVIMYEHLEIADGRATVVKDFKKGQNIHRRGSDEPKGTIVINKGALITAAEIGVLASVGKSKVLVKRNPKVTLFSTGDELVGIDKIPKPHQIRQSNSHTLRAALLENGITSDIVHIRDEKKEIKKALESALYNSDVLLMSGGVSKGKYDYLPEVLQEIGVQQHFHRVQQRPGKPFWFGEHLDSKVTVFGFPGNPTSTFANFHVYFLPWLNKCLGKPNQEIKVFLNESFENNTELTRFIRARVTMEGGDLRASLVHGNGSGDLTCLTQANGFVQVAPKQKVAEEDKLIFIPARRIL